MQGRCLLLIHGHGGGGHDSVAEGGIRSSSIVGRRHQGNDTIISIVSGGCSIHVSDGNMEPNSCS